MNTTEGKELKDKYFSFFFFFHGYGCNILNIVQAYITIIF